VLEANPDIVLRALETHMKVPQSVQHEAPQPA
jgi:hypothetical protein